MREDHMITTVYAVRATMADGAIVDLLLFATAQDALEHLAYIEQHCRVLGFDALHVVSRRVIGPMESLDRRKAPIVVPTKRRRSDA